MFLAADVGGTKVRLALFEEKGALTPLHEEKLLSRDFPDFASLLHSFLSKQEQIRVTKACFGIAGPIREGKCQATNLPWVISAQDLSQKFTIPNVFLINDLEANAWGIPVLKSNEFFLLNRGAEKKGNQVLISAGTGLGEAGILWEGKRHLPFPSEGGHCDFAPRDEEQIELLHCLMKEHEHISYERVLSGAGLHALYRFVVDSRKEKAEGALEGAEPQRIITERAVNKSCQACVHAVRLFLSIYGAEAGNLALKYFSIGGVYIGGGIAPHLIDYFKEGGFLKAFTAKGRFASLLSDIPIQVILNEKTALLGAARYAQESS